MTSHKAPSDSWASADAYERFMGRWSRALARAFVQWLDVPPDRHWLEVGCGTGALTSQILEVGCPATVVAMDPSAAFVAHARAALPDRRARFIAAGAEDMPARTGGYDIVASGLVLNFLPDPPGTLRAMHALTADGGIVAACVWDYASEMQFLRRFWDAAVALDPTARRHDEGERFPLCSPAALDAAFQQAGFDRVLVEPLMIPTVFRDFDDYWTPFVGGPGPAPGYVASLSTRERQDLERHLAATLPRNGDGAIALTARAWAAKAEEPGPG